MDKKHLVFGALLCVSVLLVVPMPTVAGQNASDSIALWIRTKGNYVGFAKPKKTRPQSFVWKGKKLSEYKGMDFQRKQKGKVRGLWLDALIARYKPPAHLDLAILHFANKMAVPYAFRDALVRKKLKIFIARERWSAKKKAWVGDFPPLGKKSKYKDIRPLKFAGNKVVVSHGWHPAMSSKAAAGVSPWRHVDSLRGIEFVFSTAYYNQFRVSSSADVRKGLRLFRQNCQFCHGARRVGAGFGWDFVTPYPVYKHRSTPHSLRNHVRRRVSYAAAVGIMMPALKHMTEEEVKMLWFWLQAIATKKMKPYSF